MPINPTTLKALIDTQITNETVDFAITPAEVGGRMKDAIDYTTEQVGAKQDTLVSATNIKTINGTSVLGSGNLTVSGSSDVKVLKTVITSAEILDIFTTPKVIVPAIAGKIIVPTNIAIVINYNSVTYSDVGGSWKIKFESEATNIATTTSFLGSATFNKQSIQTLFYSSFTTSSDLINSPIVLSTTGNNPVGGNSGITVYVTYSEITI
jgi:hypothetical protein